MIALLLVPLTLVALPLVVPDRWRSAVPSAAAALTLFALITGFTIGTPYLLAAALMWFAARISWANTSPGAGSPRTGRAHLAVCPPTR